MNHPQAVDRGVKITRRRFLSQATLGTLGAVAVIGGTPTLIEHWTPGALSETWPRFTRALAAVLAELEVDKFLILESKARPHYVQFYADSAMLRVEAVSNQYLDENDRLSACTHRALLTAGWKAPSHEPGRHAQDPGGSPNYYLNIAHPVAFAEVAALATRTLCEIYGIATPFALNYKVGAHGGAVIQLRTLVIPRRPSRVGKVDILRAGWVTGCPTSATNRDNSVSDPG